MNKGKKLENFRTKDSKVMADALIKICHIMGKRGWWLFDQFLSNDSGMKFKIYIERIR